MANKETIKKFKNLTEKFGNFKNFKNLNINDISDIEKIPFTTKKDLQNFKIENCPNKPVFISSTSGSTSKITLIGHSIESENTLLKKYSYMKNEILNLKDNTVTCNLLEIFEPLLRKINLTSLITQTSNISKEDIKLICQQIIQSKAKFLLTSSHLLPTIFKILNGNDYKLNSIVYVGVKVTDVFQKEIVKNCENPIELYASSEIPAIGIRKYPEKYFKVMLPNELHFEILDSNNKIKNEGEGILIITDFNNFSYPVIRFYSEDLIHLKRKEDNIYLEILGRIGDYIKLEGDLVYKRIIIEIIENILKHQEFLIEVDTDKKKLNDSMKIFLNKHELINDENISKIKNKIKNIVPCEFSFHLLEREVPQTRTNKKINMIDKRINR
jgi:phenylacetate-coenzyme A ligase PaaK-like adenylate-forming protein